MNTIRNASLIAVALVSVACSGSDAKQVDLGNRNLATLGEKLSDFSGNWDGYAEAYDFEQGSDRIRLTFDANGNGTVRFGDSTLAPPTSAATVYPPDTGWYPEGQSISQYLRQSQAGFDYPVHAAALSDHRLRFELQPADMIQPWCALQTSADQGNGTYTCNAPGSIPCGMVCDCTASSCAGHTLEPSRFDGALTNDGTDFEATMAFPGGSAEHRVTVRLARQ